MTTDVAAPPEKDPRDLALVQEGGYGFAADDVKLIAEQVCRPKDRMATYAELRLFLAQAQATGLKAPFSVTIQSSRWSCASGRMLSTRLISKPTPTASGRGASAASVRSKKPPP